MLTLAMTASMYATEINVTRAEGWFETAVLQWTPGRSQCVLSHQSHQSHQSHFIKKADLLIKGQPLRYDMKKICYPMCPMQLDVVKPAIIEHRAVRIALIITLHVCLDWSVIVFTS